MGKDPAVLFYTSDFLTGTAFFTDEQRGQYIRLLCEQHQNGHIPKEHMINICKTYDSPVLKKFKQDSEGLYYQERMEKEIEKRVSYSDSRRSNRMSIKDKKHMSKHMKEHMLIHMENGNENDNINGNDILNKYSSEKEIFNNFRKQYPGTKNGNDTEFNNFIKKHKDWRDILPLLTERLDYQKEARQVRKENKLFTPEWKNLQTWINQRSWEMIINTNE